MKSLLSVKAFNTVNTQRCRKMILSGGAKIRLNLIKIKLIKISRLKLI